MFFFFFFQAEDGIRDIGVTGVQTCALPICGDGPRYVRRAVEWTVRCGRHAARSAWTCGAHERAVRARARAPRRRGAAGAELPTVAHGPDRVRPSWRRRGRCRAA